MHLPINERFTSVQKDDLKAALAKAASEGDTGELASYIERSLRDELIDEEAAYGLTDAQVNNIVDVVTTAVAEYVFEPADFATDEAVQAVEDFLCI